MVGEWAEGEGRGQHAREAGVGRRRSMACCSAEGVCKCVSLPSQSTPNFSK